MLGARGNFPPPENGCAPLKYLSPLSSTPILKQRAPFCFFYTLNGCVFSSLPHFPTPLSPFHPHFISLYLTLGEPAIDVCPTVGPSREGRVGSPGSVTRLLLDVGRPAQCYIAVVVLLLFSRQGRILQAVRKYSKQAP